MALRKIPIRRVGNRHNLLLGGDREAVMLAGLLAIALIFTAQTLYATIFGVCLWFSGLYVTRVMADSDPLMRKVYMRHRNYKNYYKPRATPHRVNTAAQGKQYQ